MDNTQNYVKIPILPEEKKKKNVGMDFVHGKLNGWLWFAIRGSHVSDRMSRPRTSKHVTRGEMN